MIPSKLGPYLLEEILGRGGMGTVYRGVDPETGEQVAIKILAPDLAGDPQFLERFQEEVETLLELKHPNIVQLLSFGKQDDFFYFAMELVDGKSLYALQKAGQHFNYLETVEIGLQVCEGLHYSHNMGVIHRDLKPGNIIRAGDGQIKLADYGIAKRFGTQQMTLAGVLGTAEFMAPEQAMGKPATIQSDLYSLGAVLFALATGKPPIVGPTPQKTLEKVVTTKAPLLVSVAPDAPEPLGQLIQKLLKKQPENRLRSARSVATRLSEIREFLLDQAEMETHLVLADEPSAAPVASRPAAATMVDTGPRAGSAASRSGTGPKSTEAAAKTAAEAAAERRQPRAGATLQEDFVGISLAPTNRVIRQQDFFERAVRGSETESTTEEPSPWGTLLLAIGLLVMLSVSGYLLYDRVFRPRTANELWAMIEPGRERPMGVLKPIDTFLRLYPDDPRVGEAAGLKAKAKAFQYRNALALKASLNKRDLTDLEQQFLKWTADDHEAKWDKEVGLQALLTYHAVGGEPASERDAACLEAAEVYRQIFWEQARPEIESKAKEILLRVEAAERLQATDPAQAAQIRQSLIELFGDKKWAEPLIEPLRKINAMSTEGR